MQTLFRYLKQPSTWQGLVGVAAGFGLTFTSDQSEAIIAAAVGLISAIHVFMDEDKKAK